MVLPKQIKKVNFLLIATTIVLATFSTLETYFLIKMFQLISKSNFGDETTKNLVLYLAMALTVLLFIFVFSIIKNKISIFIKKKLRENILNILLKQKISKISSIKYEDNLFVFSEAVEYYVDSYLIPRFSIIEKLVSILTTIIVIASFSPVSLAYVIPLAVLLASLPLILKNKTDKLSEMNTLLFSKPQELSFNFSEHLYSYSINGKSKFLANNFINKANKEISPNISKVAKTYSQAMLVTTSSSVGFFALVTFFSIIVHVNAPELLPFSVLATLINKSEELGNWLSSATEIAIGLMMHKDIFKKSYKKLQLKEIKDQKEEKNIDFQTITLDKVDIENDEKHLFTIDGLKISKNDKILITGPSGCGKSTLFRLLTSEKAVPKDSILQLNGQKISLMNNSDLLSLMYLINNNIHFYEDTLENNLTFGEEDKKINLEKIMTIFGLTDLDLKEKIKPNKVKYSQGQIQRLAIIRALLSSKEILLFDESLSNIDSQNANEIIEYLASQKRTILLISHTINKELITKFNKNWTIDKGVLNEIQ